MENITRTLGRIGAKLYVKCEYIVKSDKGRYLNIFLEMISLTFLIVYFTVKYCKPQQSTEFWTLKNLDKTLKSSKNETIKVLRLIYMPFQKKNNLNLGIG